MAAASGFDDIHYLSTEGMFKAHRVPQNHRCAYCIGGCNPLSEEEIERLKTLEI
jgi:glutamine phosphoribosylpyrophosphate amidotransferase